MPTPNQTTGDSRDKAASFGLRLVGATVALVIFTVVLLAFLLALESFGTRKSTLNWLVKAFTYSSFGIVYIGWKWPYSVVRPLRAAGAFIVAAAKQEIRTRLLEPVQRVLFVVGLAALCPWLFARAIPEIWDSTSIREYSRSVFYPVLSTLFEVGRWGYEPHWVDWLVLVSLVCLALAFTWSWTGSRLVRWVRGTHGATGTRE